MRTARDLIAELNPTIDRIARFMMQAPMDAKERNALALMVTAQFLGLAVGSMQACDDKLAEVPFHEMARHACDLVCDIMESGDARHS